MDISVLFSRESKLNLFFPPVSLASAFPSSSILEPQMQTFYLPPSSSTADLSLRCWTYFQTI